MTLTADQDPVIAFGADTRHEPLRVTVRRGARSGVLTTSMPSAASTTSKDPANFVIPITDQEPQVPGPLAEVHDQIAAICVVKAPVGSSGTPRICTRRVTTSMTNNTYSRRTAMVSMWKKSAASRPAACARSKVRQLVSTSPGAGPNSADCQDAPDRTGADAMAEAHQLALNAAVPPTGIIPG